MLMRPKLGVGAKTWIALTVVFWVPVIGLSLILFYLFQNTIYDETLLLAKAHLKGAEEVYGARGNLVKGLLLNTAAREDVEKDFFKKDSKALQSLLLELGKSKTDVDMWIAVDDKQRVIARRNNKKGDIIRVSEALSMALLTGEGVTSTELAGMELLSSENEELTKLVKDTGIVQFTVAPVRHGENIVGAIVAGDLLTGDPWLGNTVYNLYGAEIAIFAGESPGSSFLHSTASLPRSTWILG